MKHSKKILAVVLCMLMMLTPLASVAGTVTVQAATQTVKVKKDQKTGNRYGYDKNNKKVTQQWGVTASGYRYYFGKNGAAYQADPYMVGKYGILIKKIGTQYYGFDVNGHTVKGIRVGRINMYCFHYNKRSIFHSSGGSPFLYRTWCCGQYTYLGKYSQCCEISICRNKPVVDMGIPGTCHYFICSCNQFPG